MRRTLLTLNKSDGL